MLRSYLTVAVRNLWRHRTYSVNSILSLAVSLAVCLLLVLLLYDQWQFDRYHEHADRIYRVVLNRDFGASASSPEALAAPNQVFLSAAWAERAFGEANPVGQSLELDDIGTVTVAGVLDLPPGPTHLQGDIFLSFATVEAQQPPGLDLWKDVFTYSHNYVLLAPGVHPEQLEAAFDDVRAAHFPDAEPGTFTFRLQSVTDIALGPELSNDPAQGILDRTALYFLGGLGLIVLVAASFTFTSLSLARALQRTKEVGVRKALGATVTSVTTLLSKEFLVLTGAALVVALPVSWLLNRWWLSNYAYHVDIGVGVFLAAIALLLAVTLGTVGWQSWRVAQVPPAETLRDE